MTKLVTTKSYERNLKKFIKHHPEMREQYEKTLKMLITDPTHPSLRLHKLQGKLQDLYSVSINMKFRMLLEFIVEDDEIILIHIGSQYQMYG